MTKFLLALFILAISGCGGCSSYPTIPRQEEATALVWIFYSAPGAPPAIEWIEQDDLDCGLGMDGVHRGFYRRQTDFEKLNSIPRQCVMGVYWPDRDLTQIARPIDFQYTSSAFAHELYHSYLWKKFRKGDPTHIMPGFQTGGAVDQANVLLMEAGIIQ
jgi:hypothetical protein